MKIFIIKLMNKINNFEETKEKESSVVGDVVVSCGLK
jgi:hypothetical protein